MNLGGCYSDTIVIWLVLFKGKWTRVLILLMRMPTVLLRQDALTTRIFTKIQRGSGAFWPLQA